MIVVAIFAVLVPFLVAGIQRPESYPHYFFASWSDYLPGQALSSGLLLYGLAAVAVVRGRSGLNIRGDPRWALLAGAALAAFLSVGADTFRILGAWFGLEGAPWNPYLALGNVVPGLRSVRVILRLSSGVVLVACVLGGIGFAVLVRQLPRYAVPASIALVVFAWATALRPALPGPEPPSRPHGYTVEVSEAEIDFFRELEQMGNTGPIFEFPIAAGLATLRVPQRRILRSFYHRRRISTCFASYMPGIELQHRIASKLPRHQALQTLRDLGFTTLVVEGTRAGRRFVRAAEARPDDLRVLRLTDERAAFEILVPPRPGPSSVPR